MAEVDLVSEVGADYNRLQELLVAGDWYQADKETRRLMLAVCASSQGILTVQDYQNFPSADLKTIDHLWSSESGGHFGFAIQKQIWETLTSGADASWEEVCQFGDTVGWRKQGSWLYESDLRFDLNAPQGHLPYDPVCHYTEGKKGMLRGGAAFVALFGKFLLSREDW